MTGLENPETLIEPRDVERLILEGRIKVGNKIRKMGLGEPGSVYEVNRRSAKALFAVGGDAETPDEIHVRTYPGGYTEIVRRDSESYDQLLEQLRGGQE